MALIAVGLSVRGRHGRYSASGQISLIYVNASNYTAVHTKQRYSWFSAHLVAF